MITHDRFEPIRYKLPLDSAVADRNRLTRWLDQKIYEAQGMGYEPIFYGPTGSGKTFALLAMRLGRPSMWLDWPEFLSDVKAFFDLKTEDAEYFDPVRCASNYPGHLLIDDVGAERDVSGLAIETFDRVVRARASSGYALSFTTNLSEHDLQARYGEPMVSRLGRMCMFIELAGADRRLERA
jgi:DNA replication protein DnaC